MREHLGGAVVGLVHEPGGLLVDQRCQVVRELGRAPRVQERRATAEPVVSERHRSDLRAHAVLGHHRARDLGGALQVVLRTRRDHHVEQDLLGRPSAQEDRETVLELGLGQQVPVLERPLHRHPERRRAARDDRDAVHRVGGRRGEGDDRVAHLVDRHPLLVLHGHHAALAFQTRDGAVDRLLELGHRDRVPLPAGGEQRGLVHDVGEIGAREPRRPRGEHAEVHLRVQRHAPDVDLEDLLPTPEVGLVDHDLAVEPPWTHQRGVEHVGAVGGRHDDHALLRVEPVHLDQQLVQRLLALVVRAEPGAQRTPASLADRVDLVEEHERRAPSLWPVGTARGRARLPGRRTSRRTRSRT